MLPKPQLRSGQAVLLSFTVSQGTGLPPLYYLEAFLYTEDCINSAHLEAASPHDSPVVFKGSPGLDEAL